MSLNIPKRLESGDTVAVIATARAVDGQAVKDGIQIIKSWGLQVIEGKSLFGRHHLFAGTDQQRLQDLQFALDHPKIKAIFCARGGYGTTRILDQLNWSGFQKFPKWICGFSDVTGLLCQVNALGYASMHSSMPQLFNQKNAQQDYQSLKKALFDGEVTVTANPHALNQPGKAEGTLVGGNLSLLVHLINTRSDIDTHGKILVIEDVDEYLYQLDRMMVQLVRCGKLTSIRGLVVGHLSKMKEGDLKFGTDAAGIISSHLSGSKIPVGFGFPVGHESPNRAIPMGINSQLQVTPQGSIIRSEY